MSLRARVTPVTRECRPRTWLSRGLQTGLEQRAVPGCAPGVRARFRANGHPYIERGGIEYVVSVLAGRGAEHHLILDSFEGVPAAASTLAAQLPAITGEVAASKDDAWSAGTAARLRVAASVFGGATAEQ